MRYASVVLVLTALFAGASAHAAATLSSPRPQLASGHEFELVLVLTNEGDSPETFDLTLPLHARAEAADSVATLELSTGDVTTDTEESTPMTLEPGAFRTLHLKGRMPDEVAGLIGDDGGLNAKFQISFRYRLFDDRGRLANKLPWIDDLYFAYSQTSLWDLSDLSKPVARRRG